MESRPRRSRRLRETSDLIDMNRRMLKAIARRAPEEDPELIEELISLRTELDLLIGQVVRIQRDNGVTWQLIGDLTGTTKQAAIQKWNVA